MDSIRAVANITSGGDEDGKLLTWDRVGLFLTEHGKSLGFSDELFKAIQSIEIYVIAGEVANAVVTSFTEHKRLDDLLGSFPEELRKAEIWMHNGANSNDISLWSIRLPLKSLSASMFPPFIKCKGIVHDVNTELKSEVDFERAYMELIYAVGMRFPGESRHATALRYIREAEADNGQVSQEAKAKETPI